MTAFMSESFESFTQPICLKTLIHVFSETKYHYCVLSTMPRDAEELMQLHVALFQFFTKNCAVYMPNLTKNYPPRILSVIRDRSF